ncbi:hypothetical protein PAXRUDRAFT_389418 [Paxillus rubicundulus Ve08.2h10]|uniref:BZIP domain-containing protein n=1 Tax=Paxillus rubicundulus Ve08.2h10 TaxID=930991 RepID=A0A0D0D145_9AGAM|nr:hypothetical protein PAXRUDRAFT_389418 [Paxillus rubicundulus Ve08.2h10]
MSPFNLQGLNVVHSTPSPAPRIDSQDPLASPFPDFSAHLDLWTNLSFESDEPLAHNRAKRKLSEEDEIPAPPSLPDQADHENVVHPPTAVTSAISTSQTPISPPFDLNALLAGFAIEPFLIPPAPPIPVEQNSPPPYAPPAPSIAQLLALHAAHGTYPVSSPPSVAPASPVSSPQLPTAKRARTQKNSISTDNANVHSPPSSAHQSPEESTQCEPNGSCPSVAEDKRRRNTAASARFRLKKKEREAALERRAKELEERVAELERECEGLRRENGWLKGLVVGVTGAGAAQQQQVPTK